MNKPRASMATPLRAVLRNLLQELALIGRAHNWDKTRPVEDDGNPILEAAGNPRTEEYDDLEGDRPSCYSGVKRRLFQSVHGHPLLRIFTKEIIAKELYDFVRQHLQNAISKNNPSRPTKRTGMIWWRRRSRSHTEVKSLRYDSCRETAIHKHLEAKYGKQFMSQLSLKNMSQINLNC